ncbi:MAG: IPT/TIG domain-containing protein [Desulfuromonadales bacterium]
MGQVIRKQMKGMSWMAKVSMVLMVTLLMSVFAYQGWFKPKNALADVSIQQAWTSVYTGTAFPTSIDLSGATAFNKTPAIAAGPNRLLVVGVSTEVSTATAAQTCTASFGGKALTLSTGNNATLAQQHTYLFYLKEADIAAASGNTLTIAVSGGTSVNNHVYAAVYNGVDQTNLSNIGSFISTSQSTTVGPISPSLTIASGDTAVEMVSVASTSSTTRTITSWAAGWLAAVGPNSTTTSPRISVYAATNSTAGTTTSQHTASSSAMRAMSGLVLKAVAGAPVVTAVSPNVNVGGGATLVTITGTGLTGATKVTVGGTLVTADVPTVIDDTQLTVAITADVAAAPGARTITVTNGAATSAPFTATGFVISSSPAPTVTSVSPAVLGAGATSQAVTISGANFVSGAGLASNFGTGVTVNSTTFVDANTLTANVTVSTSATAGTRNVIVTNPDTQTGTGTNAFTVGARPTVTTAAPATGALGATNLNVTINGTNFVAGAPLAAVFSGTGITVTSTTFVSATQLSANINIDAAATLSARTITVTNGDKGVSSAAGSFTVIDPTAVNITSVSPTTIGQGANGVLFHIYGANFGTSANVTFSSSRFVVASTLTQTGPATVVDSGHLTILVNTTTSSVASANVTVTNVTPNTQTFTLNTAVATIARPTITSITPSSLLQGTATDVTIVGTGFQTGATVAFPVTSTGITLSNVVVTGTQITAHVVTTATATLGIQTVTITNPDFGYNTTTFNVFSATAPTLTSMTPATIGQGALPMNVDVYGTNFDAAITAASLNFGSGVTTNSVTWVDATHLIANITLSTSATAGVHVVTVTNPNLEAGTASILTVTARPGTLTILPATGTLGTTFDIALTSSAMVSGGAFGVTVTNPTALANNGVTVNTVTWTSATAATANVTIDPSFVNAPLGARTLTLINNDYGTRTATLTVRGAAPTVTAASPALKAGAVAQTVTITGTNFYPGATVAFSNTGVTGGTVTVVDQNTITLPVTISAAAATGASNVTVTNSDTQTATGTGIFTVTAGPTVTSNSPISGGQGATLDVTINGSVFDAGAAVVFSDAGITVNSVTGSGSSLVANITIDAAAMKTTRSITVTNPDGSSASGGAFEVKQPSSTTTGALSFYQVTADSISVKASYTNDGDNTGTCEIKYGTADGVYTNTATATRSGSAFVATLSGLAGGSDGEGKQYFFQATFSNPAGVTGTNPLVRSQSTAGNKLTHNSLNTNSGKWAESWGTAEGKYGAITCTTCHSKNTTNSKLVAGTITTPSGTWDSNGSSSLAVIFNSTTPLGTDGAHGTSTQACEACHTKTSHHKYNNVAANHEGTVDCLTCHSHKEAFVPNCSACHSAQQGSRRVVTGPTGDFSAGKSAAHGTLTGTNSQACAACHDGSAHKTLAGSTSVALKNADTGDQVVYDGTAATASALKNACIACHDANGASKLSTNALSPFAAASDTRSLVNIDQYWPTTGGAHDTKMVCMNCHGNSAGATTALKYNAHVSATPKLLQDAGYDVINPNTYCYNCHNAASTDPNKSSKDISGELAKAYKHTTAKCFDCHGDEANSLDSMHSLRAGSQTAGSGLIANNISNATGKKMTWSAANWGGATASVNLASNTATAEYQICFKCHATTGTGTTPAVPGAGAAAASLTNLALEFNPNNASRHPVGSALSASNRLTSGKLTGGWAPGSVMTCSDCHATDTAASKGPHGSSVKWMLAGTNKAWPYTTTAGNGASTGTLFTVATYNTNNGTANGLFCRNCHTITASNNWHSNGDVTGGQHGSNAIMACASCHVRVPHGGKVSRLLQTTNAPARYKSDGNGATARFTHWGSSTVNIKGSSFASSNFGCASQHSSTGGETW